MFNKTISQQKLKSHSITHNKIEVESHVAYNKISQYWYVCLNNKVLEYKKFTIITFTNVGQDMGIGWGGTSLKSLDPSSPCSILWG